MEIKSGYGLTVADEAAALRIAREVTEETTFLGAHVVPPEYATARRLRRAWSAARCCPPRRRTPVVDVFCERGAFDADQARAVLEPAGGLRPRVHANQLTAGPGVRLAVELGAASADHCTHLTDADVDALAGRRDRGHAAAGGEFSTRSPYPDARRLLDAGVTVALATDCNPGSSYTSSMPLCIALAVREMRMTPAEAVWSATAGGAASLRRDDIGRIASAPAPTSPMLDALVPAPGLPPRGPLVSQHSSPVARPSRSLRGAAVRLERDQPPRERRLNVEIAEAG